MNIPSNIHQHPSASTADFARARLDQIVRDGITKAGPVIERVLSVIPEDRIVATKRVGWDIDEKGRVVGRTPDGTDLRFHSHALGQVFERGKIPGAYAKSLLDSPAPEDAWQRELLKHILTEHYAHQDSRALVRSVDGEVRGWLSDHYRRLDDRALLDSFIGEAQRAGAVPFEGVASDLRSSIRVILPEIIEPVPGEVLVLGASWTNANFGGAAYGISAFLLRLVCLNGAIGSSQLRQIHLGGRLPENITFSAETYAKDTETMVSATRDVVRGALGPAARDTLIAGIREAASGDFDFGARWKAISKSLTKGEQESVRSAFEGDDVVMLPPGKNAWRFSNALSWVANTAKDGERKIELQALAGSVLAA